MVLRYTPDGVAYGVPPYTEEELQDMERRRANGPVAFTRPGPTDPERLTDKQINHIRRFSGLPPFDAKELKSWRGYLRWMQGRFGNEGE